MAPSRDSASANTTSEKAAPPRSSRNSYRDAAPGVFSLLLALRLANALTLRTFFQPDEYFQSLEPAWQLAFGTSSHAYITWEWTSQLRSSLHPALFAAVYRVTAGGADIAQLTLPAKAELFILGPKLTQALFASLLDYYTWQTAQKIHGRRSRTAQAALAVSICSPWQWFCSTRTLSNCLETTITATAIYYWPWHWQANVLHEPPSQDHRLTSLFGLRVASLLAAFACILRPTNALIWLSVSLPTLWRASERRRHVLVRELLLCGSAVLACSMIADRWYYSVWTFPPVRFLYFNVAKSVAVFYGRNRPDYYLTEGLPLLLTTALPFAAVGLFQALRGSRHQSSASASATQGQVESPLQQVILAQLAWTCLVVTTALSLISHKEVRFLYPILPFLHILAARPLCTFLPTNAGVTRKSLVTLLLVMNMLVAGYVSQVHQRGVIDVLSHLRHRHEYRHGLSMTETSSSDGLVNTTVGFLMPCHSTPWRSHLVYPHISAWALTCEPPIHVPRAARATYLDEADEFYTKPGPSAWLRANMEDVQTITSSGSRSGQHWLNSDPNLRHKSRRMWPHNLVFFEHLEETLTEYLHGTRYRECWRGFNSHFHNDHRRQGDVIMWCLDGV